MHKSSATNFRFTLKKPLAAIVACVPLLLMAQPAPASLSGPSMVKLAASAMFQGSGLAANSSVSLAVVSPTGSEAHFSAVTDANGRFSYSLAPRGAGLHTLKLLDSGGRTLASTAFNVHQ